MINNVQQDNTLLIEWGEKDEIRKRFQSCKIMHVFTYL